MAAPTFTVHPTTSGFHVLGDVTITAGTPIRLAVQFPNQAGLVVHSLLFSPRHTNTGLIYVGKSGMAASGGAGRAHTIPIPSTSSVPTFEVTSGDSNSVHVGSFAVDGSVNDDIVSVSVLVL